VYDPRPDWLTTSDLHLAHVPQQMIGGVTDYVTTLAAVTDDVDHDLRNPDAPYRGADELATELPELPVDLSLQTSAPALVNYGDVYDVQLFLQNAGSSIARNVTVEQEIGQMVVSGSIDVTSGTVTPRTGGYTYNLGTFLPGTSATITLHILASMDTPVSTTAVAHASAVDENPSNNSATAIVGVFLPFPDLVPSWTGTHAVCKRHHPRHCQLYHVLWLRNVGNAASPVTFVRVYLSSDNQLSSDDVLLNTFPFPPLRPGLTQLVQQKMKITKRMHGNYLLAVADGSDEIFEIDETNNVAVYGPLP
jgi:hypothetical protein